MKNLLGPTLPLFAATLAGALTVSGFVLATPSASATTPTRATLPVAAAESCAVSDAELHWGFKEDFRSYISGTIANGEWSVAGGAQYETPEFGFRNGTGTLLQGEDAAVFAGSIEFTGHGGILDTTLANPVFHLDDSRTAHLLLDVSGTTQDGAEVNESAVPFALLDLASATVDTSSAGTVVYRDIPAVLTAEGASAFGTYLEGEKLDPLTVRIDSSAECITAATAAAPLGLAWIIALAAIPVVAIGAALVLWRRSKRKRSAEL